MPFMILLLCIHLAVAADAATPFPYMPVDQLEPGMHGTGRTVFAGVRIDSFDAQILGVVRKGLGVDRDLILARLSGGPLAKTGLARGMSGSPVYVDGRLIGAVAYGWVFAKEPICGITPIEQMAGVLERSLAPPPEDASGGSVSVLEPHLLQADAIEGLRDLLPPRREELNMEPLGTPVWIAGMPAGAAGALRELLEPLGLHVLSGPGGTASTPRVPVEPGAALGIQLIGGDMSATGIGTVTLVQEDRVLAFGHSLMLLGAADLPLTAAYVYEIIPSQMASFKVGAATHLVGALRQDRAAAVAGRLGPAPRMLPVTVRVTGSGSDRHYHFRVARHELLTSSLTRATLLGSLESRARLSGDATVELRTDIRLARKGSIRLRQVYSGPAALLQAASHAVRPVQQVLSSGFAGLEPDSLAYELRLQDRLTTAAIRWLRAGREVVHPGERLQITVGLQPYRQAVQEVRLSLAIPAGLPPGPLRLRVGAGPVVRNWEQARRPDAFDARNASHLLRLLNQVYRNDELVAELYQEDAGLTVNGRELPALPPSALAVLKSSASSGALGPALGRIVSRARLQTEYVLQGELSVDLTIERSSDHLSTAGSR